MSRTHGGMAVPAHREIPVHPSHAVGWLAFQSTLYYYITSGFRATTVLCRGVLFVVSAGPKPTQAIADGMSRAIYSSSHGSVLLNAASVEHVV